MNTLGKRIVALLLGLATVGGGATYLSVSGVEQVAKYEGQRLTAYADPGLGWALPTICRGHTGKDVYRGLTVTADQCDRWFASDLRDAERDVQALVHVPVKQGEYDALVSFRFNVGITRVKSSTLLRELNRGNRKASCNEYPKWKYANQMVLEGLVVRRYSEQKTCLQEGPYVYHPKA